MTEEITVETTEVAVDPLITTKLAYVDNLKKELEGIQEQMASLQYQMDIRVTALTLYQSSLEVVVEEEPKENGKDLTKQRGKTMLITIGLIISAIVFIASAIAAITPTPKDDKWIGKLYKIIDVCALNIGKAKNTGK